MSICGICGSKHVPAECDLIEVTSHIPDRIIPSRARLTMPEALELRKLADGTYDVAALYPFEKGTQFGPLVCKKLCSLLPAINFPLRVFCERGSEDETFSEYYLDTTNESECNWMMFVSAAADFEEQNIICYQDGEDIYYVTVKDICEGEALKVWYSPYYAAKMEKKTWKPSSNDENHNVTENSVVEQLVKNKKDISAREIWSCKFCGKTEKLLSEFALHLIQHYRMKAETFCNVCNFQFNRVKTYQEHMKRIHKTDTVPLPTEQQSAVLPTPEEPIPDSLSQNTSIGGPLMFTSLLGDSMDNTMLIFTKSDSSGIDQNRRGTQNNNNLGVEVLTVKVEPTRCENVKVLDNFNLELASNGNEKLICDICLSDFDSLKELITHMNIHSKGSEATVHDKVSKKTNKATHLRNIETNELLKQPSIIQKSIPSLPELQTKDAYLSDPFLLTGLPSDNIDMGNTTLILDSNHVVLSGIKNENDLFESENMNLNVEMILPENVKQLDNFNFEIAPNENEQPVCDICLKTFKNKKMLVLHMNVHAGKFVCYECNKVFTRNENLIYHSCTTYYKLKCHLCERLFSQEKALNFHIKTRHTINCKRCKTIFSSEEEKKAHNCPKKALSKQHTCTVCSKVFNFKNNLYTHMKTHESNPSEPLYTCPTCNKVCKNWNIYFRHRKLHEGLKYKCDMCDKTFNRSDSLKLHKDDQHSLDEANKVSCETCQKDFKNKKLLKLHQITHLDNSYNCQHCSSVFKTQKYLKRHIKHVHDSYKVIESLVSCIDKQYSCPKCNKKFKLRHSVERHVKNFHPEYSLEYKNNSKMKGLENKRQANLSRQVEDLKRTIDNMNFTTDEINQDNTMEILFNNSDIFTSDSNDRLMESLINTAVSENNLDDKDHQQDPMLSMPDLDLDHIGLRTNVKS
uniref:Zinc finger protein 62-like n=1 Tax=Diabrotica virgifera virgifera TaxID=50390 RepID=A0A6P7F266_DIAVI